MCVVDSDGERLKELGNELALAAGIASQCAYVCVGVCIFTYCDREV